MGDRREDSLGHETPSNLPDPADLVARTCAAATRARPERRLAAALEEIVRTTGMDRAFVAEVSRRKGRFEASLVSGVRRGHGDPGSPSRTALTRTGATRRPILSVEPVSDPRLAAGESVRSLRLGFLAAIPLPPEDAPAAVLLLDAAGAVSRSRMEALERQIRSAAPVLRLLLDGPRAGSAPESTSDGSALVGASSTFRAALDDARRAAASRVPVLLRGESGTGKELFARMIHAEGSSRTSPFVAVNCAALPEALLEAELFGAVRGAYTGAERSRPGLWMAARGGTLFLDEIAEMPPALQAKVLRTLQDGRVRPLGAAEEVAADVRVIAATHRELGPAITSGRFRADLYWRLAIAVVRIPPLRERVEDLEPLATSILRRLGPRWGLPAGRLDDCALERLHEHPWPGNVRELEAVLARALLRTGGGVIRSRQLSFDAVMPTDWAEETVRGLERKMIRAALREAHGAVTGAAARIGWTRQKLYRRMAALGLDRREAGTAEAYSTDSAAPA